MGQASSLDRIFRGAFATLGASSGADGSGASSGRRGLYAVLSSLALLLTLALSAAPASAATTYTLLPFSPITGAGTGVTLNHPSGIGVDETSGNVFLADGTGGNVVDIFGAEGGAPNGLVSPYQLTGFNFASEPSGVAVDNSATSPSKGALYVVDVRNNAVKKFVRNGGAEKYEAAGQLAPTSGPGLGEPLGAAVDSKGNVFVADHHSSSIVEFSPAGTQLARIDVSGTAGNPSSVALDAAGDLFVQGYGDGRVYKYPANISGEIEEAIFTQVISSGATGITVDILNNQLLVALGNHVTMYQATSLAKQAEFGTDQLASTERIAINSASARVYVADKGANNVAVFGAIKIPGVSVEAPSFTGTSATLKGKINPDGLSVEECKFEYGPTTSYGSSTPCEGAIPVDSGDHAVTSALTGLANGTTYHFRLVARNTNGSNSTVDETFTTLGRPRITEQSAAPLGTDGGLLRGQINPLGVSTHYRFEWGADDSYGHQFPSESEPSIGSGNSSVEVSANLSGLEEGTTYHYHVVATNEFGTTEGPDQTFSTEVHSSCPNVALRAGQTSAANPDGSTYLPSCMALEMVSPPRKFNQSAEQPVLSASGNQTMFHSIAALGETPRQNFEDSYIAVRGPSGWTTHATQPPVRLGGGGNTAGADFCTFTPDFSRWDEFLSNETQAKSNIGVVYQNGFDGALSQLSPTLIPFATTSANGRICAGGAADASAIFFGVPNTSYLPGDPLIDDAGLENIYEARLDPNGNPSVELLTRDKDGVVVGGQCGAAVGWYFGQAVKAYRGSISPDASRVYFTSWPTQAGGISCDTTSNKTRVMVRQQTPAGAVISEVSHSECTRVSPPCDAGNYDDEFKGASQEGDRVFFTSARQLTNTDLDTAVSGSGECKFGENGFGVSGKEAGCDLYLYDAAAPPGSRLTQVSAGDATDPTPGEGAEALGLAAFAGDGSRAYFQATGVLTTNPNAQGRVAEPGKPNLYLYERDAAYPAGRTVFIATVNPQEELEAGAVPLLGSDPTDRSIGGDGHILVFGTRASLTPDDTDGGGLDVYRYDSDTGSLQRISRAAPGGSDNGSFDAIGGHASRGGSEPVPRDITFGRQISEDGNTIVFASEEALDPSDSDGNDTAYLWHDGSVTAIRSSSFGSTRSYLGLAASMSGEEVAFTSDSQLLPEDGDGAIDVYVARTNGGFPPPLPPTPCVGEACQGAPSPPPAGQGTASDSFVGPGNAKSAKKPKKHRRKHRKHRHASRRATHEQGGQK